jgi:hypothetical protein
MGLRMPATGPHHFGDFFVVQIATSYAEKIEQSIFS